jgi:hypothetical protein
MEFTYLVLWFLWRVPVYQTVWLDTQQIMQRYIDSAYKALKSPEEYFHGQAVVVAVEKAELELKNARAMRLESDYRRDTSISSASATFKGFNFFKTELLALKRFRSKERIAVRLAEICKKYNLHVREWK